jgi:hypothetical protein
MAQRCELSSQAQCLHGVLLRTSSSRFRSAPVRAPIVQPWALHLRLLLVKLTGTTAGGEPEALCIAVSLY